MPSANLTPVDSGLSIIIVGCGKVGSTITAALYREGHDITVIDKNPATVQALTNSYDVMGIVGNGASYSVQMEAGIEFADLIIAVTGSDELNLLCCTVAKRVGHCDAIARVRNPDYAEEIPYLREQLGLTMIINPELEAASEIARILYLPRALAVSPCAKGQAELVRFRLPEENELCDKKLMDLGALVKNIRFCAIERAHCAGRCPWVKPISCRLYPIRASLLRNGLTALNLHRWEICKCAFEKGRKEKVPVWRFLREPLIAAYGQPFYDELTAVATAFTAANCD